LNSSSTIVNVGQKENAFEEFTSIGGNNPYLKSSWR